MSTITVSSPARWRDLIAAEWIKFRTLRSTPVILLLLILLAGYVAYRSARGAHASWPGYDAGFREAFDLGHEICYPPAYLLLMTIAGVVGAQTVVGEHASGLIRTTLIAVPARGRVMVAKAVVVSGVLAVVGLITGVCCVGLTLAIYGDRITAYSWDTPGVPRLIGAAMLTFAVSGLIGLAVGALVRNGPATVFALMVTFLVVPLALSDQKFLHVGEFTARLSDNLPFPAWVQLSHLGSGRIVGHHASTTQSWITLPAWGLASVVIAVLAVRERDV
ncbi:ABC transporter permease [Embleya sp. AB8]|uniref:ABC transporter permease n=1 Tax=Embleya sp. AB8 TaxID=3156304 RepID=UPI003C77212E